MAPEIVLDYVVAYEVAHLQEMNHSHNFWALCYDLSVDMVTAKLWLKQKGQKLHRIFLK